MAALAAVYDEPGYCSADAHQRSGSGLLIRLPSSTLVLSCSTLGGCGAVPEDEAGTAVLQHGHTETS